MRNNPAHGSCFDRWQNHSGLRLVRSPFLRTSAPYTWVDVRKDSLTLVNTPSNR